MHSFTSKASRDVRCNWKPFKEILVSWPFPPFPHQVHFPLRSLYLYSKLSFPRFHAPQQYIFQPPLTYPTLLTIYRQFFLHPFISSLLTSFPISQRTLHPSTPPRHYLRHTFPRLSLLRIIILSLLFRCV